jgi:hypothetical protein
MSPISNSKDNYLQQFVEHTSSSCQSTLHFSGYFRQSGTAACYLRNSYKWINSKNDHPSKSTLISDQEVDALFKLHYFNVI